MPGPASRSWVRAENTLPSFSIQLSSGSMAGLAIFSVWNPASRIQPETVSPTLFTSSPSSEKESMFTSRSIMPMISGWRPSK